MLHGFSLVACFIFGGGVVAILFLRMDILVSQELVEGKYAWSVLLEIC